MLATASKPTIKFYAYLQHGGELRLLGTITAFNSVHAIQVLRKKGLHAPVVEEMANAIGKYIVAGQPSQKPPETTESTSETKQAA